MMFNAFDYSAVQALFVLPVVVILVIAPLAPGGVLAARLGDRPARTIGMTAFGCYLAAVVGLVLLPLPADAASFCAGREGIGGFSFVPFRWVDGVLVFMDNQGQRLTLQGFLHNETIYQALSNIGLLLPLGVGLRLFFGWRLGLAVAVVLGFSLAIEVIQGTGLLGLLPCAHRLGDVDDLMLNVAGGVAGWFAAGYLRPAAAVRFGHRLVAFAIDLAILEAVLIVASSVVGPFLPAPYAAAFLATAAVVVVVPAIASRGRTIGKAMAGIRLTAKDGRPLPLLRTIARYLALFGVPAALFLWPQLVLAPETNDVTSDKVAVFLAQLGLILLCGPALMLLRRDRRGLHDLIAGSDHRTITPSDADGQER